MKNKVFMIFLEFWSSALLLIFVNGLANMAETRSQQQGPHLPGERFTNRELDFKKNEHAAEARRTHCAWPLTTIIFIQNNQYSTTPAESQNPVSAFPLAREPSWGILGPRAFLENFGQSDLRHDFAVLGHAGLHFGLQD